MAAEVANNQPAAVPATEENVTEKKADEVAADVKEETKSVDDATKAAENHADGAAPPAPAKVVPPKVTVHKADFDKDVIYLYQFSRTPFLPSISPYCLKVETWLRLAGLKYEVSQRLEISRGRESAARHQHRCQPARAHPCTCTLSRGPRFSLYPSAGHSFGAPHGNRSGDSAAHSSHIRRSGGKGFSAREKKRETKFRCECICSRRIASSQQNARRT